MAVKDVYKKGCILVVNDLSRIWCYIKNRCYLNEMRDSDHHVDISPLKELNVGFVSQFVLDYMHLVCLGIVRKIIYLWMKGPLSSRISAQSLSVVSVSLSDLRHSLPREFARKPRSLSEFNMWKATEFRQFLLYTGPVVLHGKIPNLQYKNFMLLSVAIRMVLSDSLCSSYCDYVEMLIEYFVKDFAGIYMVQTSLSIMPIA